MPKEFGKKLVIAISSRALFNLDDSHDVYIQDGLKAYSEYQIERENEILNPGSAFPLVEKLLREAISTAKTKLKTMEKYKNIATSGKL